MNTFDKLPPKWQREVRRLRTDCARYRTELREAQRQLADRSALGADEANSDWTIRGLQAAFTACCKHHPLLTEEDINAELAALRAEAGR